MPSTKDLLFLELDTYGAVLQSIQTFLSQGWEVFESWPTQDGGHLVLFRNSQLKNPPDMKNLLTRHANEAAFLPDVRIDVLNCYLNLQNANLGKYMTVIECPSLYQTFKLCNELLQQSGELVELRKMRQHKGKCLALVTSKEMLDLSQSHKGEISVSQFAVEEMFKKWFELGPIF